MFTFTKKISSALLIGLAILSTGCASQQRLSEYQSEVLSLREERAELKKSNGRLRQENQDLEVALIEASSAKPAMLEDSKHESLDMLGVDYRNENGNFVISIPSSISFAAGRAEVTKQGKTALKEVAEVLHNEYAGSNFWIEGHTDSDPISKSKWASNRDLSVNRAMAVLHYLVDNCGIEDSSCVVAGHGEYQAIDPGTSATAKAKNRRVEIVVHS